MVKWLSRLVYRQQYYHAVRIRARGWDQSFYCKYFDISATSYTSIISGDTTQDLNISVAFETNAVLVHLGSLEFMFLNAPLLPPRYDKDNLRSCLLISSLSGPLVRSEMFSLWQRRLEQRLVVECSRRLSYKSIRLQSDILWKIKWLRWKFKIASIFKSTKS